MVASKRAGTRHCSYNYVRGKPLIAEKSSGGVVAAPPKQRTIPWIRLLLSILLGGLGLWFIMRDATLPEVLTAFGQAKPLYILLALFVITLTSAMKAWRWRYMFQPQNSTPAYKELFWVVYLGQLFNTAIPFFRISEIVRIFALDHKAKIGKSRILGTLVVEKLLELLMVAFTLFLLLPFLVVPDFVKGSSSVVTIGALLGFFILWLVAYQTERATRLINWGLGFFPAGLRNRLQPIIINGLAGLSALRHGPSLLIILVQSAVIAVLYVLPPLILFSALNIDLGFIEATAIHVVLNIGTIPSWAPANVGIFEFFVDAMLTFFGVTAAGTSIAYTLIFHLTIVLPQVILGGIAIIRSDLTIRQLFNAS